MSLCSVVELLRCVPAPLELRSGVPMAGFQPVSGQSLPSEEAWGVYSADLASGAAFGYFRNLLAVSNPQVPECSAALRHPPATEKGRTGANLMRKKRSPRGNKQILGSGDEPNIVRSRSVACRICLPQIFPSPLGHCLTVPVKPVT
jgi:hypothetical protein